MGVGEIATQMFITNDKPNVSGLFVAGSAEFKQTLTTDSDLFDPRLAAILIPPLLDVSYGGENGFNQAVAMSAETLSNVKFIKEKKLISKFLDEVSQDTGKYCFGMKETMSGLDMGAVETLIVWEEFNYKRIEITNPHTGSSDVIFVTPEEEKNPKLYRDAESGVELDIVDNRPFIEWIVENFKTFGTKLEFVSDRSQEGNQLTKGFGGIGGVLRYKVEFEMLEEPDEFGGGGIDSDEDFM